MILVDSAVWIDHLRSPLSLLDTLLDQQNVLSHPFVIGEISMGSVRKRSEVLQDLQGIPSAIVAIDDEVQRFVTHHNLFGLGIGYIDAHLLVSTRLTPDARLWTRDKRLHETAKRLGIAISESRLRPD